MEQVEERLEKFERDMAGMAERHKANSRAQWREYEKSRHGLVEVRFHLQNKLGIILQEIKWGPGLEDNE
jgi:hypothetical protein